MNNVDLINEKYSFRPLKKIIKTKKAWKNKKIETKIRTLYIAGNNADKEVYSAYSKILLDTYEKYICQNEISSCVTAYRKAPSKNNIGCVNEIIEYIKNMDKTYIYMLDLKSFFDNIDHKILKKKMCQIYNENNLKNGLYSLYKNVTKYSYTDKENKIKVNHKNKGIPQGLSVSGVLANIYMIDCDKEIKKYVEKLKGVYRRYSDDIIILLPVVKEVIKEHTDIIKEIISEKCNIELNKDKEQLFYYENNEVTNKGKIINIDESKKILEYLGFSFDGYVVKMKQAIEGRFYKKMYAKIKTIGNSQKDNGNRITKKGNVINKRNLYKLYSGKETKNINLASYEKKAEEIFSKNSKIKFISIRKNFDKKIALRIKKYNN